MPEGDLGHTRLGNLLLGNYLLSIAIVAACFACFIFARLIFALLVTIFLIFASLMLGVLIAHPSAAGCCRASRGTAVLRAAAAAAAADKLGSTNAASAAGLAFCCVRAFCWVKRCDGLHISNVYVAFRPSGGGVIVLGISAGSGRMVGLGSRI